MAKQTIGIGASANDGSGDPIRIAFDKVNDNFNELYGNGGTTGNTLIDLFDSSGNFDLTGKPHKISFYYDTLVSLQALNPGTYHGAIGHAHDTGSLYYAHGSWRRLLADTSGGTILNYSDPLAPHVWANNVTNSETSDYVLKTNADGTYTWVEMAGGGGSSYADANVDTHLNTSGASADEVLSWTGSDYAWVAQSSGGGSSANTFGTITVAGQSNIVADSATDGLTIVAGSNMTITTDASTDTITFNASGSGGGGGTDLNSLVGGTIDVAADSIGFIDADDSNASKKELIADLVAAIAGTNVTASNGVLSVAAPGNTYTNADVDGHLNVSGAASNQFLQWSGSDYQWAAASGGGGGAATRVNEAETTGSIADGASGNIAFSTLGKSFGLLKVTVDKECWVRIYSDTSSRTADASRTQGTDPADGSGVIAEFISTTSGTQVFKVTPSIIGWLDNSETTVPVAVQNNSGTTGTVQVTIDALKLES
jgi:hypothetical protein